MFAQPASAVEGQQAPLPLMHINSMAAVAPTVMADAAGQPHLVLPVPLLMSTSAQYGVAVGAAAATAAAATAAAATAAAYKTNQALPSSSDPTASALKTFTATEAASLGSVMASGAPEAEKHIHLRKGAGRIWSDPTLDEWPENDFRVFCGDLGNEVTDEVLANAFRKYKSFEKARVVRDKRTGKTKGYGFASFSDPHDMLRALKEMNFKYVGNRPIRVLRSKWKDREVDSERNKKFQEVVVEQPANSKTLRKFKKLGVTVNGGKMARQQQAAAAMGVKVKKNYVPVTTYGRMTYQYIKGSHTMAPVPSQGTCAAPNLLDDI